MFASSFNDPGPSARAILTLAFSGCLWLAGVATAEPTPEANELRGALMARFGALDWSGDDRFPMPCDEAEGAVHRAEALAAQDRDAALAERFAPVAAALKENEQHIVGELNDAQGEPVDIGGYYRPDDGKADAAMRPSETMNAILGSV